MTHYLEEIFLSTEIGRTQLIVYEAVGVVCIAKFVPHNLFIKNIFLIN